MRSFLRSETTRMGDNDDDAPADDDFGLEPEELVKDVWVSVRLLGRGNFGKVYHMCNVKDGREAALKMEKTTSPEYCLKIECEVMKKMKGIKGVVQIFDEGSKSNYKFILMTLCGWDLTRIGEELRMKFSDSTILRLAIRTLLAIKALHEVGYVHRDLKPCNFALDYSTESLQVYLLDFGMTRQFAMKVDGKWVIRPRRSKSRFRGTLRYCSINMHRRLELGRGDDLWSWLYMIMELRIPLPWRNTSHPDKVEVQKAELVVPTLGKEPLMKTFVGIVAHLQTLNYPDRPNYKAIFEMLAAKIAEAGVKFTDPMDYDQLRPVEIPELQAVVEKHRVPRRVKATEVPHNEEAEAEFLKASFESATDDVPGGSALETRKFFNEKSGVVKEAMSIRRDHKSSAPNTNK